MMTARPFRSPVLKVTEKLRAANNENDEPQTKKRRISHLPTENGRESGPQLVFKRPGISSLPRKPLLAVMNPSSVAQATQPTDGAIEGYYNVLWYERFPRPGYFYC